MANHSEGLSIEELLQIVGDTAANVDILEQDLNMIIGFGYDQLDRFIPTLRELVEVLSGPRGIAHSIESEMD